MEIKDGKLFVEGNVFDMGEFKILMEKDIHAMEYPDTFIFPYMRSSVIEWVEFGRKPGSFLSSFISNDLKETYARADSNNIKVIRQMVGWFWGHAPVIPTPCWGTDKAVLESWPKFIQKLRSEKE